MYPVHWFSWGAAQYDASCQTDMKSVNPDEIKSATLEERFAFRFTFGNTRPIN